MVDYKIKKLVYKDSLRGNIGYEHHYKTGSEMICTKCLSRFIASIDVYEYPMNIYNLSVIDKESILFRN